MICSVISIIFRMKLPPMKRVLILLAIFFCLLQMCSAQAYRSFLVDSAHWLMTTSQCYCDVAYPQPTDCSILTEYSYKLDGNDTIDGIVYKRLIQSILKTVYPNPDPTSYCGLNAYSPCRVVALLREDTAAKKVYIRRPNGPSGWCSQDTLLYDFSLQIGDSMKFNASCPSSMQNDSLYLVDSINYELYGTLSLKTWYLHDLGSNSNFSNLKLYESVGASVGFWGYRLNFDEGQLENGLVQYCLGSDSACGFNCVNPLLGVTSSFLQNNSIAIYPNPTKNILTLDINNLTAYQNLKFVVSDILGQEIQTEVIIKAKTEVNISALGSGIYLWHLLSDKDVILSGKVVHD